MSYRNLLANTNTQIAITKRQRFVKSSAEWGLRDADDQRPNELPRHGFSVGDGRGVGPARECRGDNTAGHDQRHT